MFAQAARYWVAIGEFNPVDSALPPGSPQRERLAMSDSPLFSANAPFLEDAYARYRSEPDGLDPKWRSFFAGVDRGLDPRESSASPATGGSAADRQSAIHRLISAYRYRGYCIAEVDPLDMHELYGRPGAPDVDPKAHGFTEADLDRTFDTDSLFGPPALPLREIVDTLQAAYCTHIGTELAHLSGTRPKRWVQERLERARGRSGFSPEKKREILEWVIAARGLEEFLHTRYPGQKRFSLEGGESLIPLLDEVIQRAGAGTTREIVVGMAHRGRLNVLVNVLGKLPAVLFEEFEGKVEAAAASGDVKYHLGFSSDIETEGGPTHIVLAFNPSHLEIINPVVEGSVRARQARRRDTARNQVLPVLIHGDAAFAGQGVVTETLNLSETRGYSTGGTIHIIVNNLIGFTNSDPLDSRSSSFCTDVAKLVQAPIFHVNGNHPEAVAFVARMAVDYRMEFGRDVVIDLVCYRRHGHNEADEPMVTQPLMYAKIRRQRGVHRLYAEQLEREGVIAEGEAKRMYDAYLERLAAGEPVSRPLLHGLKIDHLVNWTPYLGPDWRAAAETGIPVETVEELGRKLCEYPSHFRVHRVVERILTARREMARGERPIDWGFAEMLAFGSLLRDGYSLRMSGQDCERGTFAHRHATVHNQDRRGTWQSLAHLRDDQPRVEIINSLLSEEAVLGFEYGYSSSEPEGLIIWEAQFGDFANGAQVVIDQFLSSSEAKWGRYSGMVLLLPHGYEGAGPEHSSARLERFLQLCAEDNLQVCVPTTPAQIFHLLRRQMIRPYRKPLVVMSPKSLLRHRGAVSDLAEFAPGRGFQVVIDDPEAPDPDRITRLVLCAGKLWYELAEKRREAGLEQVALVRVEQVYPYPREELRAILDRYPKARDVIWAQEEPRNQGVWFFMLSRRHLAGMIPASRRLGYAGRGYSASPAAGYFSVDRGQQRALVESALGLDELAALKQRTA